MNSRSSGSITPSSTRKSALNTCRQYCSPTKTTVRQTEKGRSGSWEFIEYEEIPHYTYVRDPSTGRVFRQLSHVTKEEKGKTVVEFTDWQRVDAFGETLARVGSS